MKNVPTPLATIVLMQLRLTAAALEKQHFWIRKIIYTKM